jgi:hypothetical protein
MRSYSPVVLQTPNAITPLVFTVTGTTQFEIGAVSARMFWNPAI